MAKQSIRPECRDRIEQGLAVIRVQISEMESLPEVQSVMKGIAVRLEFALRTDDAAQLEQAQACVRVCCYTIETSLYEVEEEVTTVN